MYRTYFYSAAKASLKQFLDIDEYLADHLLWQSEAVAGKLAKSLAAFAIITTIWINQQFDKLEPAKTQKTSVAMAA